MLHGSLWLLNEMKAQSCRHRLQCDMNLQEWNPLNPQSIRKLTQETKIKSMNGESRPAENLFQEPRLY
jgi:hypothetical protein